MEDVASVAANIVCNLRGDTNRGSAEMCSMKGVGMGATVINTDVMEWCRTYDGPKFHCLLCDPPYHLRSDGRVNKTREMRKIRNGTLEPHNTIEGIKCVSEAQMSSRLRMDIVPHLLMRGTMES